jgi:hypothetical protein
VRLYLVLSVVFFLWATATQPDTSILYGGQPPTGRSAAVPAAGAPASPGAAQPGKGEEARNWAPFGPARPGESHEQRGSRLCNLEYHGPWEGRVAPLAKRACIKIIEDNGRSLREAFVHNVPRAMFLFLPLLAVAMKLMYWRPRHYYVEHLLLFVHNHAFVFLLLMLAWTLTALLPFANSWVTLVLWLYIPWYMFRSMRVVYGQGRALTFAKLTLLSFYYMVFGSMMLALTTLYSALTL